MRREELKILADELLRERHVANLRGPNTRNPAGGCRRGLGWQCRGTAAKTRERTAGIGGRAVQLALTI